MAGQDSVGYRPRARLAKNAVGYGPCGTPSTLLTFNKLLLALFSVMLLFCFFVTVVILL